MTHEEARDEMFTLLRTEWQSRSGAVVGGSAPTILWQGIEKDTPPTEDVIYARASIKHFTGRQSSLGPVNGRLFGRTGAVFIQVFVPLGIGNHLTIAVKLGRIALEAYEGRSSPGGIWFRSCRLMEIGPTDGWFQVNVVNEFSYDEVK